MKFFLYSSHLNIDIMDEEGYDSSDIDFGPPPVNPFASAGRKSIQAIIEHAEVDRVNSEKMVKRVVRCYNRGVQNAV